MKTFNDGMMRRPGANPCAANSVLRVSECTRHWLRSDGSGPREALMGASGNDMSSLDPNSGTDEDG
jgi:hypothetical protein